MRIRLLQTSDPHTDLKSGDLGTVIREHDDPTWGTVVDVKWDNGSNLSLIWGHDSWKVLELTNIQ